MKHSRVSAFARVARFIALAAVALGLGAGSLLAQGSTGKIEGRVRDQAGAPIANAQVFMVGTAFNALTNPQGYYFINNVPAGTVGGARRLHRLQVDPGRRREGARRPDHHGGRAAGADGGPDPGDHRRHPDPAAGAARRGHHQAADRRRVRRQAAGRPDQRRPRSSSRASPRTTTANALDPRRPQQRSRHLRRRRAGPGRLPRRSIRAAPPAPTISDRHQRVRRGLGHHRFVLRRVRQRQVRHHLDRHQDRRQRLPRARSPTRRTSRSA